ncbi:unnamed protein product (macronuclear) [Paramecium tetraurelia]|uniref:Enkurin domain-containing protein n=1 Tax=Paramecium tetraurelia TaxID=5888 RepID=A0BEG0_PARTE|nr:uncharacterized protein GSPATT00027960001 [Paramecium tetraurelia]CAK56927.1 unnamed protein product [Paramecium tetraurelia]|eukprot:XP_001424325.1 hypothetical protein (macronuclear) [Paramecium tetraurelia strain d4-2]
MLFRQKEKIQDVGRNNFREFYRMEHEAQTKTVKMMPSVQPGLSRSMNQPLIDENQSSLSGSSWDAKHLDTFLKQSKYSSMRQTQDLDNQAVFVGSGQNQSFFFRRQQPRIIPEYIDYLNMSKINHIVSDHPVNHSQEVIRKRLEIPEKNYVEQNLALSQVITLKKPSGYLAELRETQEQQKKFHQWREEFGEANKAYRKIRQAYKSGIIGIDNPTIENSELYKDEHQKYKQKQENRMIHSINRYQCIITKITQALEKYASANPNIEFDNRKYDDTLTQINHTRVLGQYPVQYL